MPVLLKAEKESLSPASYEKYFEAGTTLFEQDHDQYLKSAIMARYARLLLNPEANGGKELSLDVVADMIRYYANSVHVASLYLVKLMKLPWYSDALSYKRRGYTISGMAYRALPMGAVPVAYYRYIRFYVCRYQKENASFENAFLSIHSLTRMSEPVPVYRDRGMSSIHF